MPPTTVPESVSEHEAVPRDSSGGDLPVVTGSVCRCYPTTRASSLRAARVSTDGRALRGCGDGVTLGERPGAAVEQSLRVGTGQRAADGQRSAQSVDVLGCQRGSRIGRALSRRAAIAARRSTVSGRRDLPTPSAPPAVNLTNTSRSFKRVPDPRCRPWRRGSRQGASDGRRDRRCFHTHSSAVRVAHPECARLRHGVVAAVLEALTLRQRIATVAGETFSPRSSVQALMVR